MLKNTFTRLLNHLLLGLVAYSMTIVPVETGVSFGRTDERQAQ